MVFNPVNRRLSADEVLRNTFDATLNILRTKPADSSTAGGQGNKTVTVVATPVQLAASTPCTSVIITARVGNTKEIAYGFSNAVRATAGGEIGACLQPGDSVVLRVANLNLIWLDAQVANEGVSFTYTTD